MDGSHLQHLSATKLSCCMGFILALGAAQFFIGIAAWLMSGWGLAKGTAHSTLAPAECP